MDHLETLVSNYQFAKAQVELADTRLQEADRLLRNAYEARRIVERRNRRLLAAAVPLIANAVAPVATLQIDAVKGER